MGEFHLNTSLTEAAGRQLGRQGMSVTFQLLFKSLQGVPYYLTLVRVTSPLNLSADKPLQLFAQHSVSFNFVVPRLSNSHYGPDRDAG